MSDNSGDEGKDFFDPEQEIKINWTPLVNLPEVENKSGEENDDILFKTKAKIYRFRENEWKERGQGDLKLLRNRLTKKIRLVMRQERTLKVVANFLIEEDPLCILKEHLKSDRSFFFIANDFSEYEKKRKP